MVKLCLPNPFLFGSSLGSHSNEDESWCEFTRVTSHDPQRKTLCMHVCAWGTYCFCNNIIEGQQIWKHLGKHRLHNIFFSSWPKREQKLHESGLDITSIFRQPYFNSHATLVLVIWPGHENWENSHSNSRFSTLMQLLFSFDRGTRIEKTLMQTLTSQLSCNSCSRLPEAWELRKLSFKLSLLNSHVTLALVWPGHDSWENSHANSRLSTLMQLLFSFDQDTRIEKTLMQTLASQLSPTFERA
jgi:hypothetical protein